MKRGIIIVIVGIVLIVVTGIAWVGFQMGLFGGEAQEAGETVSIPLLTELQDEPTPVPPMTQIVIAVQDIPRGWEITGDSIALWDWPSDAVPPDAIVSPPAGEAAAGVQDVLEMVIGQRMRTSAVRFEPILTTMVIDMIDLTGTGSDAALAIPSGRVLMAIPLPSIDQDPTAAVAYALRPGDHIDLMASLALVDLDEEFHTKLPNRTQVLDISQTAEGAQELTLTEFPSGRIEEGPLGLIFNVIPGEANQRPRLVTQLTVQDAVVVRVGRYPTAEEEEIGINPLAAPTPTPVPEDAEQEGPPAPAPKPIKPRVILLAVTPQEALVIKFAWEINADIDFVIRPVGEVAQFQTSAVTLQYLMETYNMVVPPKLQYGFEPPLYGIEDYIRQGATGE